MEILKFRVDGSSEWHEITAIKGEKGEKGEQGPQGIPGKNGYTPVKGKDYWTEQDQQAIKTDLETYIDKQLGVIEDAYY